MNKHTYITPSIEWEQMDSEELMQTGSDTQSTQTLTLGDSNEGTNVTESKSRDFSLDFDF